MVPTMRDLFCSEILLLSPSKKKEVENSNCESEREKKSIEAKEEKKGKCQMWQYKKEDVDGKKWRQQNAIVEVVD